MADEDSVASVPENLPLEQAAGVPLVALTAWQALQQGKPQAGQRVLITAAAGGVGHVAVQVRPPHAISRGTAPGALVFIVLHYSFC